MTETVQKSFGEILRNKREELRMEIAEVSSHLRIKPNDIAAIENDEIIKITTHIYIPGLLRSYAKFLRIDEKIIEEQIKFLQLKSNVDNKKHLLVNLGEGDHLAPNKNFSFHALIILFALILLLFPIYNQCEDKSDFITNPDLISQLKSVSLDGR